jgi:tRNA (guanine37-N1)-methyltransferase
MVLRPDVVDAAIASVAGEAADTCAAAGPLIHLSPRGAPLTQARVRQLAAGPGVTLLCGRFEGVDQRVLEARSVEEISLGDYVLSGGELAAMVLLDACVRLLPGVIGEQESLEEESFEAGLLEYPHYTRPQTWQGRAVPEVLLSGHHGRIRDWRRQQSESLTQTRRPDLWRRYRVDGNEQR